MKTTPFRKPRRVGDTGSTLVNGTSKMTTQEILTAFTRILRDLLLDDSIVLSMETRREDIPGWDSFNYINFIVAVEIEFGVKFRVADVESFANVGAIVTEVTKTASPRK